MRYVRAVILLAASLIFVSGCATVFKGTSRDIFVDSSPPGAEIYVDGSFQGETPATVKLNVKSAHQISVIKAGFVEEKFVLMNEISPTWVIVDGVFLFLPAIVDGITGAWYDFDRTRFRVSLQEIE